MTNKKVIIVIVIFIMSGLLIYSFANPLNDENGGQSTKDKTEEKVDNKKDDDVNKPSDEIVDKKELEDIIAKLDAEKESGEYTEESLKAKQDLIDAANKAKTKEEYEKALEDIKKFELVSNKSNESDITTQVTKPSDSKAPSSGNNQYVKPSGNSAGSTTTNNKPSTSSGSDNQGTIGGDNKPSTPSGSENQGTTDKPVTIDKTELTTLQNELNSAKNSGKYTDDSITKKQELIDIAKSKTTQSDYDKALNDVKNYALVEKVPKNIGSSIIDVTTSSNNSSDKINVTSKQNGTDIILGGSIETSSSDENGQYVIRVKVTAPTILTDEVLRNATFRAMDNVYGVPTDKMSAYSRILNIQNISTEKAYITLPSFSLRKEDIVDELAPLRIAVDWGNGENIIYNIYFNDITIKQN